MAIELGLTHALSLGLLRVVCASDCLTAMNMLQRNEDVSTYWDRDAVTRIRLLAQSFTWVQFVYVPRDQNNAPDCLARQVAKDNSWWQVWKDLPPFVLASLYLVLIC